ncbi:MAG: hypothetical protein WBX25_23300 [Rhodomicrobium sp.]
MQNKNGAKSASDDACPADKPIDAVSFEMPSADVQKGLALEYQAGTKALEQPDEAVSGLEDCNQSPGREARKLPETPKLPSISLARDNAFDTQNTVPQSEIHPPTSPHVALTIIENACGPATKAFSLDPCGKLQKNSAAEIYEGTAKRIEIAGLVDLMRLIDSLQPNQALCYGVAENPSARLVTQEVLRERSAPGAIARDRNHFSFPEDRPGILMLDHDPRPGHGGLDYTRLDELLCELVPPWQDTARLWRPSSSAFVFREADGVELIGLGGWRCYVIVDNAAAIPAVGAFIYQEAWRAGYGYIQISKAGRLLDRSIVDAAVWQPERIDFAAAPLMERGLLRRAPAAVVLPGVPILYNNSLTAPLSMAEWRKESKELAQLKDTYRPKSDEARQRYMSDRITALKAAGTALEDRRLREILSAAVTSQTLTSDFVLYTPEGKAVTVGAVLADPKRFNGARFADPLEPDYRNDRRIAYANLGTNAPFIFSHAHGGTKFRLFRESADILIAKGEQPRAVDETLEIMRSRGDLYERAGEVVRIAGDGVAPVGEMYLSDYLGRCIRYLGERRQKGETVLARIDVPPRICGQILAKMGERGLRSLNGIITAPTLRRDGSLLNTPGFDERTGLLVTGDASAPIPLNPTAMQLKQAYAALWRPFADFPFVSKSDRGVMLAALLTAFVRRSLPFAPAFSFDAPQAGSGKTLLGLCILRLCGMAPQALPDCGSEEELRKTLLSALREGKPGLLLDNVRGVFGSSALEAFLTAEFFSGRVLGATQMLSFPTSVMFLISGNNFMPKGDLWRRILTARIDAKTDAPERRAFNLNPLEYCARHRQEMVAAGLTLLRGFIAEGKPRDNDAPDRLASFEAWDDLIRQCLIWLGRENIADAADPTACIRIAKEREPEREKLGTFLEITSRIFKNVPWCVSELIVLAESKADLRDILSDIAAERGKINPRLLGSWLSRQADVRCGGKRIVRDGVSHHAVRWRIETGERHPEHNTKPKAELGSSGVAGSCFQSKRNSSAEEQASEPY